ncbi:ABC transporter ATP-binding protein [bacterium]|nr:ABC transporter ATP-binding protein [bacterium]
MNAASSLAVELRKITKAFGSGESRVFANTDVNLSVRKGSIHAIVGENGAGKSTAMKILFGMQLADSGELHVFGKSVRWRNPTEAMASGIGMVHQHFMLAGPHTVLENIVLGCEKSSAFGILDTKKAAARLRELCERYSMPVDPDRAIEDLPVGVQQRVEILKLLYRDSQILILDEPTAVLTPQEIEALFTNLRRLRDEGRTILIITHKLKEVLAISDEVTVLRQGKTVGSIQTKQASAELLAEWMVGRKVILEVKSEAESKPGVVRMKVTDLVLDSNHSKLKNVSLEVRAGEIVGVAGVEGNGQSELLKALLDPKNPRCLKSGKVELLGRDVSSWSSSQIRRLQVGFMPEDRHRDGMLLDEPVELNILLGLQNHPAFVSEVPGLGGVIRKSALDQALERAWVDYDLRPRQAGIPGRSLSGGNQQKLVIAREFEHHPEFLVAAHPTRGVDVGAIEWIHRKLFKARDQGTGILLVSSELDEILSLSDRIIVMFQGEVVAEFSRGNVSAQQLGLAMSGGLKGGHS